MDAAWTEKGHKTWVELEAVESRKPFLSGGETVCRTLGAEKAAVLLVSIVLLTDFYSSRRKKNGKE